MRKITSFKHHFVENIPDNLKRGVLYISIDFSTMIHLCACGCDHEVVTPLSPLDWKFLFDGETVSVTPSIGSWSLPCRSHYNIRTGAVIWAAGWSDEMIAEGRKIDLLKKRGRYGSVSKSKVAAHETVKSSAEVSTFRRVFLWFKGN
tara:strand:+ start:8304 stop:8744 length:441 start_codon:yes stop_codon:yes gene_type:complete